MPTYTVTLNGETQQVEAPGDIGILWVLRDILGLTGPKYGCGVNVCKACTCHVNGEAQTTCQLTLEEAQAQVPGRTIEITTIEGLADGDQLHPVQQAWLEMDVAQCGFCQPGQIMTAAKLVEQSPGREPTDEEIDGIENVCRCGTYCRIRDAIKRAHELSGRGAA
jgi:isoquinoline 1-oxidoreductase subunit alpha